MFDALLVLKARQFAVAAHRDQMYGDQPYRVHLEDVATLAHEHGVLAEVLGWLHDTVEDTAVTLDEVEAQFGLDIRGMVALLTDEPGFNRKTRKAATNAKLAKVHAGSPEATALIVKACDRLANVRSARKNSPGLLNMYDREHQAFREAVYRPGLCDQIWAELDLLLG